RWRRVDRAARGAARRRGRRQRRRAATEHADREARPAAPRARSAERAARVEGVEHACTGQDRAGGAHEARAPARGGTDIRRAPSTPVTSKVVNRRIRLLFVLLALALAGSLARAVWLQGVMAQPLSSL